MKELSIRLALQEATNRLFNDMGNSQKVLDGFPRLSSLLRGTSDISPEKALAGWFVQSKWVHLITRACELMGDAVLHVDEPFLLDLGDGMRVQCHPDVVTRTRVWEIKSVSSSRFAFAKIQPFRADREQLQAYLVAADREEGVLLYEDRDSLEFAVHLVERDDSIVSKLRSLLTGEEECATEELQDQKEVEEK